MEMRWHMGSRVLHEAAFLRQKSWTRQSWGNMTMEGSVDRRSINQQEHTAHSPGPEDPEGVCTVRILSQDESLQNGLLPLFHSTVPFEHCRTL